MDIPIAIERINGFAKVLTFSLLSPPAFVSASTLVTSTDDLATTFTIAVAANAPLGEATVLLHVTDGTFDRDVALVLTVTGETFTAAYTPGTVYLGRNRSYVRVKAERTPGFTAAITAQATAGSSSLTVETPIVLGDTFMFPIKTTSTATLGEETVSVTLTSGTLVQTAVVPVSVRRPPDPGSFDDLYGSLAGIRGGLIALPATSPEGITARAVAVDSNERTCVSISPVSAFGLSEIYCFHPWGEADASFGTDGHLTLTGVTANALRFDVMGRLLYAGVTGDDVAKTGSAIGRLLANGQVDMTFGTNGRTALASDPNGDGQLGARIVVDEAGNYTYAEMHSVSTTPLQVFKVSSEGALDPFFGTNGSVSLAVACNSAAFDYALLGGDSVFLGNCGGLKVGKLTDTGVLDTTFNGDGFADVPSVVTARSLALSDNRILVGGSASMNTLIQALDFDGMPDLSFGPSGQVALPLATASQITTGSFHIDGARLYLGFTPSATPKSPYTGRIDLAGSMDATYGAGGVQSIDFGLAGDETTARMTLGSDHVYMLMNRFENVANREAFLYRVWR